MITPTDELALRTLLAKFSFEQILSALVDLAHARQVNSPIPRTARALSRLARKLQAAEALASSTNL